MKHYSPDYEIEVWRLDNQIKNNYYEAAISGVKFRIFKSFRINKIYEYSFRFFRNLKNEVLNNDPVLITIHTHHWLTYTTLFKFKTSKIISTHHGEWSPFFKYSKMSGLRKLKSRIEMIIEKRLFKRLHYIFAIDKNQVPYFRLASPDIKYIMWSSGVNFEYMHELPKTEARELLGWQKDKKYILYVGKMYKYKQADDLIRMWLDIKNIRPGVELVVIGSIPNDPWEEFHDLAKEAGVIMPGRVLNKELYKYYSASDLYVLIALRDDYFGGPGIAALEALACNRPVVSYAMRNYIGDNLSEIAEVPDTLDKYKEALLKVLDNPGLYKNLRESVFKYYSHESVIKNTRKVFEEIFEERKNKNQIT